MKDLTELERAVLDKLLAPGVHRAVPALLEQAKRSRLRHREHTGVGFWTDFAVPRDVPAASPGHFSLTGVHANIPGLKHGAGFAVHVRDGYLHQLEGFTYDEPWPTDADAFQLRDTRLEFGQRPTPAIGQLIVAIEEVRGKQELFQVLADGLHLPDWFGWSWDALEDSLRDLTWLPQQKVVIYHDALPDLPPSDLSIYVSILAGAVQFWEIEKAIRLTVRFAPELGPRLGRWDTVGGR